MLTRRQLFSRIAAAAAVVVVAPAFPSHARSRTIVWQAIDGYRRPLHRNCYCSIGVLR